MVTIMLLPLTVPPLLAGLVAARPRAAWTAWADRAAALVVLACGAGLLARVSGGSPVTALGGVLRADALSAFLLATVGAVAVVALWGSAARPVGGRFAALVALFLAAMSLAVLADNLGVLWVAVEATTITTAFLVGHSGGRASLEAAWKYVVLGSVGVAVAFLGVVLLYAAGRAAGTATLSWSVLATGSVPLDPQVTRLAIALATLGFATKAGLAPMHSWLPDAHSQAPAPVSGLMSGVLLSVALYAILRVQAISDAVLGPAFLRALLVAGGLASLAVAAALLLVQRDYKRLLAYSSIEHLGLLALGAAVGGPVARAAVLLHMLGHGLVKATMFVLAGRILAWAGTSRVDGVRDLLARRPDLAVPFLAGAAALAGFPPFVLFFTETAIVLAGWRRGLGWVMGVALVLLLVAFAGIVRQVTAMTLGAPRTPDDQGSLHAVGPGGRAKFLDHGGGWLALGAAVGLSVVVWPVGGALSEALAGVLASAVTAMGAR
jgi:hydrogenase-4 component F